MNELLNYWGRFWGLSWWVKGPSIGGVAFIALLIIAIAVPAGDNDDHGEAVSQEASPSPSVSASPSPTVDAPTTTPDATPTPEPTPTPTPIDSPTPDSGDGQPGDVQEIDLEVAVWDDSIERPVENIEVWVRGYGSWYPDLTFGGDVNTLGAFPVGELQEQDFFIYPDGRDGTEIRVEFQMTADMISGSDMSMTTVAVSDTTVTVTGQAIPGFEVEFER